MNNFPWYATELFLIVCEARGISAASRFGHVGLSQPALSSQMASLESHLGKKLFHRKPFCLTADGETFRQEAIRIQQQLDRLRQRMSTEQDRPLRLAASDLIIRDHLPRLLKNIHSDIRKRIILREAPSQDLPSLVKNDDIDLAIGLITPNATSSSNPMVEKLAQFPFTLHIPPSHQGYVRTWDDMIPHIDTNSPPGLIGLPTENIIMQHIHGSLRKWNIHWPNSLEVSSLSHVPAYVQLDFGFGFTIHASPHTETHADKHTTAGDAPSWIHIPTTIIPPITLGVWHSENMTQTTSSLLNQIRLYTNLMQHSPMP